MVVKQILYGMENSAFASEDGGSGGAKISSTILPFCQRLIFSEKRNCEGGRVTSQPF